ncbi:MAG TPA: hypothetical protein VF629_22815 [Hymenobacter sp.]
MKYHDHGFWCNDAYLEVWTLLFVKEVEKGQFHANSKLKDRVVNDWYLAATVGFVGCIDLSLDDIITSDEDRAFLLNVAEVLNAHLSSLPIGLPVATMAVIENEIRGEKWPVPPLTNSILKVGVLFSQLMRGDLTTKSNSPLDYLKPENWNRI